MSMRKRVAFSLVELVVVISILLLLIMVLMPGLNRANKSATNGICQANLHHLSQAYTSRRVDENPPTSMRVLSVHEWKVAMLPYVSDSNAAFICPEDEFFDLKMTQTVVSAPTGTTMPPGTVTAPTQTGLYALRTYANGSYLGDMPLKEGPLCKRLLAPDGSPAGSYILSFEDQRNGDGTVDAGTDWSFHNPDLLIMPNAGGSTTIKVVGGQGGYRWDLVAPDGSVLMRDLLKAGGAQIGDQVIVPGTIENPGDPGDPVPPDSPRTYTNYGCSYGMNFLAPSLSTGSNKVLLMDFPTPVIQIANPSAPVGDNDMWQSGAYIFARHFSKANVLFADGGVQLLDPAAMDPVMIDSAEFDKLWKP